MSTSTSIEPPLADLASIPSPPGWFQDALGEPFTTHWLKVDSVSIEARSWGTPGKPGVIFIHGSAAHIGWWSFIAPFFAKDYHVVTFSLSGMGNSGWRPAYSVAQYAAEVWAVADATGMSFEEAPLIIAHSLGGFPAIHASAVLKRPIKAVALFDVALPRAGHEPPPYGGHKIYPSVEAILGRFRLAPPQPCENRWIAEYLGRMAIKEIVDSNGKPGWTWCFDPALWGQIELGDVWGNFTNMRCPVAVINGALSVLTTEAYCTEMKAAAPAGALFITMPEAHHHVMVDQPLATVSVLRTLFAAWKA